MLNKLKQRKDVSSWADNGRFVYRGKAIEGSHMLDLVRGVTGSYSFANKRTPKGWHVFMKALAELNVPMAVVEHVTNKQFLERLKIGLEPVMATSSTTPFKNVPVKKRKINWLTM